MSDDQQAFDNPDVVTQVEDEDAESLAGGTVTFDPGAPDDDDESETAAGAQ